MTLTMEGDSATGTIHQMTPTMEGDTAAGTIHQMTLTMVGGVAIVLSLLVCHLGGGGAQGGATPPVSLPGVGGGVTGATHLAFHLDLGGGVTPQVLCPGLGGPPGGVIPLGYHLNR